MNVGGTPAPLSKYSTSHGAHGPGVAPTQVPRDSGQMADGKTGGNYSETSMTSRPNNPGPSATQDGAEQAQAAFQANCQ
jgi:hypothetical protein